MNKSTPHKEHSPVVELTAYPPAVSQIEQLASELQDWQFGMEQA